MGNLAVIEIPTRSLKLLEVSNVPIIIEENEQFLKVIDLRDRLLEQGEKVRNKISSDDEFNFAGKFISDLKKFLKFADDGTDSANDDINEAKKLIMASKHKLKDEIELMARDIARNHGVYKLRRDAENAAEQERLEREAEKKRREEQRVVEFQVLQTELDAAQKTADEANGRNQAETKSEIQRGIKRLVDALKSPATMALITNPAEEAYAVRQLVGLAIQHEQGRIAAAQAVADGNKKAAAAILKASAKLEAPEVEEVYVPRVQAAPVIARKPELFHAAGSSVGQQWRVKRVEVGGGKEKTVGIVDPNRVCREHPELCEPSESKLNDLAKRLKSKPDIPGVIWELDVRTKGVR